MRPLSKNIKTARKKKGLKQRQVASDIGVDRARYAAWEEDRAEPHYDLLKTIMEYYGLKESDFGPFIYNENFWK